MPFRKKMMCINKTKNLLIARKIKKAESFESRLIGLLNRKNIDEGEGLLISKCKQIHTFFMKFPIDVVFLGSCNEVLKIITLKPFRLSPLIRKATSVLELKAGVCRGKIETGDLLDFPS